MYGTRSWAPILMMLIAACGGGDNGGSGNHPPPPVPVATITLAPGNTSLDRGQSLQFQATLKDAGGIVLHGRVIIWRSEDETKVKVTTAGLVEAFGAGSTYVVATAEGKSASARIDVIEPHLPVSQVMLNAVSELLEEGDTLKFAATAYDIEGRALAGRAVQWSSSNILVASVSAGGVVTALQPGDVAISAQPDALAVAVARSGIPERTLKRRFRLATGTTPIDFLQNLRIEEAKRILETTRTPVEDIGCLVGYDDGSFFRRLFKRKTGLTAGAYRRMFQQLPAVA